MVKFTPDPPGDVVTGASRSVSEPGVGSVLVGEEISKSRKASPITVSVGDVSEAAVEAAIVGTASSAIVGTASSIPSFVGPVSFYVADARI